MQHHKPIHTQAEVFLQTYVQHQPPGTPDLQATKGFGQKANPMMEHPLWGWQSGHLASLLEVAWMKLFIQTQLGKITLSTGRASQGTCESHTKAHTHTLIPTQPDVQPSCFLVLITKFKVDISRQAAKLRKGGLRHQIQLFNG